LVTEIEILAVEICGKDWWAIVVSGLGGSEEVSESAERAPQALKRGHISTD
jgi:hypothetical protein